MRAEGDVACIRFDTLDNAEVVTEVRRIDKETSLARLKASVAFTNATLHILHLEVCKALLSHFVVEGYHRTFASFISLSEQLAQASDDLHIGRNWFLPHNVCSCRREFVL